VVRVAGGPKLIKG